MIPPFVTIVQSFYSSNRTKGVEFMTKKIAVKLIMQLRAAGMSQSAIARERQMSKSSVCEVFQIAQGNV